eukprot:SAG11_NODE_3659_length_2304_cov_2.461678_1_plen_53_part_10
MSIILEVTLVYSNNPCICSYIGGGVLFFYMCHTVFEQKYPDFIEIFGLSKNAI